MNQTMTHTDTPTLTATTSATANASRTKFGNAAPRRWWRALDRMTLETMSPSIPAHVRAAMNNRNTQFTEAGDFAAVVRASAPGRDGRSAGPDARSNAEFARAIRAAAPGQRDHR